jgi:hypothetical protein
MDANGVFCTTPELTAALKLVSHLLAQLAALADRPDANVFVYLDQGRCQQQSPGLERFLAKRTHSRLKRHLPLPRRLAGSHSRYIKYHVGTHARDHLER